MFKQTPKTFSEGSDIQRTSRLTMTLWKGVEVADCTKLVQELGLVQNRQFSKRGFLFRSFHEPIHKMIQVEYSAGSKTMSLTEWSQRTPKEEGL